MKLESSRYAEDAREDRRESKSRRSVSGSANNNNSEADPPRRRSSILRRRSSYRNSDTDEDHPPRRPRQSTARTPPSKYRDADTAPGSGPAKVRFADEVSRRAISRTAASSSDEEEENLDDIIQSKKKLAVSSNNNNNNNNNRPTAVPAPQIISNEAAKTSNASRRASSLASDEQPLHEMIDPHLSEEERLQELLTRAMEEAEVDVAFQHKKTVVPSIFKKIMKSFIEASEDSMNASLRSSVRISKKRKEPEPLLENPKNVDRRREVASLQKAIAKIDAEMDEWVFLTKEFAEGEEREKTVPIELDPIEHLAEEDVAFLEGRNTKSTADKIRSFRHALNAEVEVLRQSVASAKNVSNDHAAQLKKLRTAVRDASYEPYRTFHDAKSLLQQIAAH